MPVDPCLQGHAEVLPLIAKEHLPSCAHTTIIEQMVAGQIGTDEEILSAIERNEYNHLTATYYLLAERVLSCYRQAQASRLMQMAEREMCIDENSEPGPSTTAIPSSATSAGTKSRSRSNSWRGPAPRRAYSILKEESEEELSTYLRAASSRQSSRFYNVMPSSNIKMSGRGATDVSSRASLLAMSRANSNDSFAPGSSAIMEDDIEGAEAAAWEEEQQMEKQPNFEKPRAESLSGPPSIPPLDMPSPSATSTPFLQRLLAPIRENRDQSPDTIVDQSGNSIFQYDTVDEEDPHQIPLFSAIKSRHNRAFQSSNTAAGQLPPLPASPDKHRMGSGGCCRTIPTRPLRNAASLELFPPPLNGGGGKENGTSIQQQSSATSPPTPNPNCSCWTHALERHPNFTNLSAIQSSSNLVKQRKSSSSSLSRRNSSPSVSMFRASSSLHSSRDRISPQAIQELLEFSRLGQMRRTASPDSRLSSRSPSPSCMSSGRVSPAVISVGGIVTRMKATNSFLPASGGMRKLSSSPHLLGICEEIEELELSTDGGQSDTGGHCSSVTGRRDVLHNGTNASSAPTVTRSARSASMGLTSVDRLSIGNGSGNKNAKKINTTIPASMTAITNAKMN